MPVSKGELRDFAKTLTASLTKVIETKSAEDGAKALAKAQGDSAERLAADYTVKKTGEGLDAETVCVATKRNFQGITAKPRISCEPLQLRYSDNSTTTEISYNSKKQQTCRPARPDRRGYAFDRSREGGRRRHYRRRSTFGRCYVWRHHGCRHGKTRNINLI